MIELPRDHRAAAVGARSARRCRETGHIICAMRGAPRDSVMGGVSIEFEPQFISSDASLATGSRVKIVGRDPVLRVEDIRPA